MKEEQEQEPLNYLDKMNYQLAYHKKKKHQYLVYDIQEGYTLEEAKEKYKEKLYSLKKNIMKYKLYDLLDIDKYDDHILKDILLDILK